MRLDQLQHLALRVAGSRLLDKDLVGQFGIEPALLGQIGTEIIVDLQPAVEFERLQADGEQLGGTVIGGVGRHHDQSSGRKRAVWKTRRMITLSASTR